jgi:hypothetical protein
VDGKAGASGNIVLTLSLGLPPNDDFAYRVAITNFGATITASNEGATAEPGEPNQFEYYYGGHSLWWSWTAPEDMIVGIDTTGTDFGGSGDVAVVVYIQLQYQKPLDPARPRRRRVPDFLRWHQHLERGRQHCVPARPDHHRRE